MLKAIGLPLLKDCLEAIKHLLMFLAPDIIFIGTYDIRCEEDQQVLIKISSGQSALVY